MVDLYAADLELEPIELWKRALELWEAEEGGTGVTSADAGPGPRGPGEVAAAEALSDLRGTVESRSEQARRPTRNRKTTSRRKPA